MTHFFRVFSEREKKKEKQKKYKRDKTYTYSKACDMWSLGVIIYILLCGYPPFFPAHPTKKGIDKVMKKRIQLGEFEFPREEWELVSENAKRLIRGLLKVDQESRLTIEQVLEHSWLVEQVRFLWKDVAEILIFKYVF